MQQLDNIDQAMISWHYIIDKKISSSMHNEIIICEPSNSNLFPFIGVRHVGKDFFDVKDISPMFESTQVVTF